VEAAAAAGRGSRLVGPKLRAAGDYNKHRVR